MKSKIIALAFLTSFISIFVFNTATTYALDIEISATQENFYKRMMEAAELKTVTSLMKRCMKHDIAAQQWYTTNDLRNGDINRTTEVKVTFMWLEKRIEQFTKWSDMDGELRCDWNRGKGTSVFHQYVHFTSMEGNLDKIYCNGPYNGFVYREKTPGSNCDLYLTNTNSNYKIDKGTEDGVMRAWKYLRKPFDEKVKNNKYIDSWDNIGEDGGGFTNVDGYFNYLLDYNVRCSSITDWKKATKPEGYTDVYPVTKFTLNENDNTLNANTWWYHLENSNGYNGGWTKYLDKQPTNCKGLIERIEELRTEFNGIENHADNYKAGYEGVLLKHLDDSCEGLTTDDGKNAWDELKAELEKIRDGESYKQEDKDKAIERLKQIEDMRPKHFVTSEGKEEDENGKTYKCFDPEELKIQTEEFETPAIDPEDPTGGEGGDKDNCYTKAGSLGWILCPIIESARTAIIESYGTLVEPALQMDSCLFIIDGATKPSNCKNTTDGTYQAWKIFRDIANVAFVILFIIVIFSQVTGFGIDNYGVKKALPKLLVAAVLINLSFIICQGAIDLCNITGKGIGGLFQSITKTVGYPDKVKVTVGDSTTTVKATDEGSWQDTNTWGKSFASNWLGNSALVILVAALGIGIVLSQGLAIIIPVFMLLISVVVAILGLVAILGIRQAVAVLLVVVSPLAFACYILPNTKSIFDKWFKTFQGLLLAYPICSALVYGGDMAATILMNAANGNLWVLISAAVISVAPIFIIPKIIRSSMGALSGGIANLSHRVGGYAKGKARGRMENSALTNRRNYNQMMRNQKHAAGASQYNANRGKKVLNGRIGNKLAKGGQLSAAQRRKYNVAMGAVNSNNQDSQNAYASSFDGIGDNAIEGRLMNNIDDGRIKDTNMLIAGLNSIHDEDKLTRTIKKLNEKGALDRLATEDKDAYHRVAQAMQSRKDSVINQSIGKLMDKGETVSGMYSSGSLKKKVQDAGTSVMATQNKDVFNTEGAADLFSNDQLRAGLTAGYSGGTAAAFNGMMQNVNDDRMSEIVGGMTAEDVSNLKSATVQVKGDDGEMHEKEVGALATIGRGSVEAGGAFVQKHAENAVNQLRGVEGDELRPNMDEQSLKALNIKNAAPSDGSDAPAAAGGEPTVVDSNPNQSSISSGINVNNMTEDDYNYIQWQHDHNPGSDAPAAEGGMTIDHGNSSSSSSSSNDHHFSDHSAGEGHATGSMARAEARAASEASGSSSSSTSHMVTPPAGAAVPHAAAPTAPDLNSVSSTGTKRDAEGHVVGERAKEGNYFDYHPKQKGEDNAAYSARNAKEHEMEKVGYSIAPKGANETGAEYRARVSKALKDAGLSGGKPADSAKPADSGPRITTNHHKS